MLYDVFPEQQALAIESSSVLVDVEQLLAFKHEHLLLIVEVESFTIIFELITIVMADCCC